MCSKCRTYHTKGSYTGRVIVRAKKPSHKLLYSCWCAALIPSTAQLLPCLGIVNAHMFWFALKTFHWHKWFMSILQCFLCHHTSSIWHPLGFMSCEAANNLSPTGKILALIEFNGNITIHFNWRQDFTHCFIVLECFLSVVSLLEII